MRAVWFYLEDIGMSDELVLMWGVTPDRNAVGPVLTYADDHTHYWPLVVFGVASIIVLDPIVSCTRLWARVGQVAR